MRMALLAVIVVKVSRLHKMHASAEQALQGNMVQEATARSSITTFGQLAD